MTLPALPPGTLTLDHAAVYDGKKWKRVKNLGWLVRNWKSVTSFDVRRGYGSWDATLIAFIDNGNVYATPYASRYVLANFLDRSIFRGIPVLWLGTQRVAGPDLANAVARRA